MGRERAYRVAMLAGAAMTVGAMAFADRIGFLWLLVLGAVGGVLMILSITPEFERKRAERGTRYVVEVFGLWAIVFAGAIAIWVTGTPAIGFGGMAALLVYALVMKRGRPQ
jgi:hypothetical protein